MSRDDQASCVVQEPGADEVADGALDAICALELGGSGRYLADEVSDGEVSRVQSEDVGEDGGLVAVVFGLGRRDGLIARPSR